MVERYFLGGHHSRYPIEEDGQLIGMLSLAQVKAVPRERWRDTRAADIAERDLDRLVVPASLPVDQVLDRLVGAAGRGARDVRRRPRRASSPGRTSCAALQRGLAAR